MKRTLIILSSVSIALMLSFSAMSKEKEDKRESGKVEKSDYSEKYEGKIYGEIQNLPPNKIGTWVVKGKNVIVDRKTSIEEKYGKIKVGAYVEIEGIYKGKIFTATEIEVKKSNEDADEKEEKED